MNELYEELETPEGERKIFRIAKARDKATKDFSHMKQIKNEHGVVLRDLDRRRRRSRRRRMFILTGCFWSGDLQLTPTMRQQYKHNGTRHITV